MHILDQNIVFPQISEADEEGLLAVGGDLSLSRLKLAYQNGIFPWFNEFDPILWWCPDPRFVIFPSKLRVSKSMRQLLKKEVFEVTINKAFDQVINACAKVRRKEQDDTWINSSMITAYSDLHKAGLAKSIEVWRNGNLVGGLYGVDLNSGVFFGESMFSKESNASKYGFIKFIQSTNYKLIDCQIYSKHLESLGAEFISRTSFTTFLK